MGKRKADAPVQPNNGVHKHPPEQVSKKPNPKLEKALDYTGRGWFVIPLCWPNEDGMCACPKGHIKDKDVGKAPLLGNNYQHERADQDQVIAWWSTWPEANIGILLEPSKLLIVEIDSGKAFEELHTLGIPKTLTVYSSKGQHYYYERSPNFPIGRSTQRGNSKAIDILSSGYIVAPGSIHRTGHKYRFENEQAFVVEPPNWISWMLEERYLLKQSPSPTPPASTPSTPTGWQERETDGERVRDALRHISAESYDDWLLMGMALHWWDTSSDGRGQGRAFWDEWSSSVSKKFNAREQQKKWSSFGVKPGRSVTLGSLFELAKHNGWRPPSSPKSSFARSSEKQAPSPLPRIQPSYQPKQPQQLDDELDETNITLPHFPIHALPSAAQDIVQAYAESVNAAPDISGTYLLALMALALGPNWEIEVRGFRRAPRLWVGIVAPPGSAKTPVMLSMMEPIEAREEQFRELWEQELREWNQQKKATGPNEESSSRPQQQHVKTNDFNIDALVHVLSVSPQGLLIDVDELSQLFGLLEGSSTGGKNRSRGQFLSMWSGKPVSVVRKRSDDLYVKNPFVIVCGGTPPDTLRQLELKQGDGMAQRFLWCVPQTSEEDLGYGTKVPESIRLLWERSLLSSFESHQGLWHVSPQAEKFGDDALKSFKKRSREMNKVKMSAFGALYAKAADHLHRLIATLYGIDCIFGETAPGTVDVEVFERAHLLTEYYIEHSKLALSLALSGKSEAATYNAMREKDWEIFKALKLVVQQTGEATRSTTEWCSLLEGQANTKVGAKSLGRTLKRISVLPLPGLLLERPPAKDKNARFWKIIST